MTPDGAGASAQPPEPPSITTPDALRLRIEPAADCGRYDGIRKGRLMERHEILEAMQAN